MFFALICTTFPPHEHPALRQRLSTARAPRRLQRRPTGAVRGRARHLRGALEPAEDDLRQPDAPAAAEPAAAGGQVR